MLVRYVRTHRARAAIMSPHSAPHPSPAPSPARTLLQMNSIHTNMLPSIPGNNYHTLCEPIFNNTIGEKPLWIDSATTLRITTHNVQGLKPFLNDAKLQSGIGNMVSLHTLITCLTETNVEWRNYGFCKLIKRPLQNTVNHHAAFLVHPLKVINHHTINMEEMLLLGPKGGLIGFTNLVKILWALDDDHFSL
jgi:hypothetical protein